MVLRCVWGQCHTDSRYPDREPGITLIRFPGPKREHDKCIRWIKACGRPDMDITKIDRNKAVCSKHFVGGNGPTDEFPDPVPAVPCFKQPKQVNSQPLQEMDLEPKYPQEQSSGHRSCGTQTDENCISSLDALSLAAENTSLKQTVLALEQQLNNKDLEILFLKQESLGKMPFSVKKITCLEGKFKNLFQFYTGLTFLRFSALLAFLVPSGTLKYPRRGVCADARNISPSDALFMTLCRYRHNFRLKDLAVRFNINETSACQIFRCWTDIMFRKFGQRPIWPRRETIIENMPVEFRKDFPRTLIIIDGTELRTEKPCALGIQSQMFSDYKSSNTFKGLIGCDPRGTVIFVSLLFTGSISDKSLAEQCGFYKLLASLKSAGYICDGDAVMADKGFEIHEELQKLGLLLNIPPKASSSSQMCPADSVLTQKIAKYRVHIERVIRKIKLYKIVSDRIPTTLFKHINKIWLNCACLTSFQDVFVKDKQPIT